MRAQPFVPFTIFMGDGREHRIPHPECLLLSNSGRVAFLINPDDTFAILDLLLLTETRLDKYIPAPGS